MSLKTASVSVNVGYLAEATLGPQGNASPNRLTEALVSQTGGSQGTWPLGTGPLAVNQVIVYQRTIAASASETLNLFDGSLLNVFGESAPLTGIKVIQIGIIANTDNSYSSGATVGDAAANANPLWFGDVSDTQTIDRYVPFCQGSSASKTVSAGAANVKVQNDDAVNALTYYLVIGGTT